MQMLRAPEASQHIGFKHSTLYLKIKGGLLPPGVRIGPQTVAWPKEELDAINRARAAGCTDDEVRQLVRDLVAARKERVAA